MASMDIDSFPFDDMATAPVPGQQNKTFVRKDSAYVSRCNRFARPAEQDFTQQFASIYFTRLETLRPSLKKRVQAKGWLKDGVQIVDQILKAPEGEKTVVICTLFKSMKLKPSMLRDYQSGTGVVTQEKLENYCAEDDTIILEDTSGRIPLSDTKVLGVDDIVTGLVVALLGIYANGSFVADEVLWPGLAPQPPLPAIEGDKYVAIISGLGFGGEGEAGADALAVQMMVDYIAGHLGGSQDIAHAASVVRVIVAGNSFAPIAPGGSTQSGSSKDLTTAARELDAALVQLCSAVPVDIMAGAEDPAQRMMPQQPMYRCLFPNSSKLRSLSAVTNPYDASIEGVSFFGTSGQNVDDLWLYTKNEEVDRVQMLENTLHWRHCAPTIPDTLACYPYKSEDPFLLTETPHVYFAANQPEFGDRLVRDEVGNVSSRVIEVPSFAATSTVVLLNLRTLECEPVVFNVNA